MPAFTPDQQRRWEAWQRAKAVRARGSDRLARSVGLALLGVLMTAPAITFLR
jgi:hypothetical protein